MPFHEETDVQLTYESNLQINVLLFLSRRRERWCGITMQNKLITHIALYCDPVLEGLGNAG